VVAEGRSKGASAIVAFVLGVAALCFCWLPLVNWALAIAGLVAGSVGFDRARQGAPGKRLALAGLVCNVVGLVVGTVIFLMLLAALNGLGGVH
jgi:hypothetical protein